MCRRARCLLALVASWILGWSGSLPIAGASPATRPGVQPVGVTAVMYGGPPTSDSPKVIVYLVGEILRGSPVRVHCEALGSTRLNVHKHEWTLIASSGGMSIEVPYRLAGNSAGSLLVSFSIGSGQRVEEIEVEVPLGVADTARVDYGKGSITRSESIVNGKRRRYAEGMMVPVKQPTRITQSELVRYGTRAAVLIRGDEIVLRRLPLSDTLSVILRIAVDASGRPVDVVSDGMALVPEDSMDILEGLKRWKFRAGQLRGRPVADWVRESVTLKGSFAGGDAPDAK